MNLFELFVKIGVDDQASDKISSLSSKLGNGLKTAAKIGTAAVGAAAAGITALTTSAVNNYAEYEQLVGGVETLFGDSAKTVENYANNAYKTAGLSANEYMETVTSFSVMVVISSVTVLIAIHIISSFLYSFLYCNVTVIFSKDSSVSEGANAVVEIIFIPPKI